ncbi:hypothetical protein T01_10708 [Trichinella spiralis]|uniref:Uncharacterized protein n=1 Tax=Trichinella spiralis TaxID=6334 RepID=A0A0V1BLK4_TRISP|nr:hypothetical protein T01_10708 [Trichinella spiralis]
MLDLWQNSVDRHNIACEIIVSILFDQNEFFKVDLNRFWNAKNIFARFLTRFGQRRLWPARSMCLIQLASNSTNLCFCVQA